MRSAPSTSRRICSPDAASSSSVPNASRNMRKLAHVSVGSLLPNDYALPTLNSSSLSPITTKIRINNVIAVTNQQSTNVRTAACYSVGAAMRKYTMGEDLPNINDNLIPKPAAVTLWGRRLRRNNNGAKSINKQTKQSVSVECSYVGYAWKPIRKCALRQPRQNH